jgi:hypothetical protein
MKRLFQLMVFSFAIVSLSYLAFTQSHADTSQKNPLVRLLQTKGIITEQEAAMITEASSSAQAERRLAELLVAKGLITRQEYDETLLTRESSSASLNTTAPRVITATHVSEASNVEAANTPGEAPAKDVGRAQAQADGGVTTVSKLPIKIYGSILFNANYLTDGANNIDIPLFGQKQGNSADQNHQNFNATLRESRFGLRYEHKIFNDAKLTGVFEFDLMGGKPAFPNAVNADIFRVRLAYGRIDWANDSLEAGQDWAVFAPLNPTSLASYGIPGFSTSGNLWNRMPQIRYEHREGEKSKLIFTAALLDPNAGDNSGNPAFRVIGLGERGSLPAFETRLGFTTPSHGKESSSGVSGHYSRLLGVIGDPDGASLRSPIDSYGVNADANVWLSSGFRITGEVFHGRALGILSGNIAQSAVVIAGRARGINSTGGWFELHGEAPTGYQGSLKNLSMNLGYGIENNRDEDLLVGMRKRNQTYMINSQYKFSPNFTLALEYRRVLTDWFREPSSNQKLNWVSLGYLFSF